MMGFLTFDIAVHEPRKFFLYTSATGVVNKRSVTVRGEVLFVDQS
jgi:hypothetical protein